MGIFEPNASPLHTHTHTHTVHDWCNKWHIHVQPNNITTESILEDLNSLCINSRMFAIAATSLLAEAHAKKIADGLQRYTSTSETTTQEGIPPSLTAKLCQLLEDPVERVRVPAAITLHCMGKENIKVCISSQYVRGW